jgi:hypothetical protein
VRAAAWPLGVLMATNCEGRRRNVPPVCATAGRAASLSGGMSPRVAWRHSRHSQDGLFCHLHSQVVFYVNELERVVSFAKISLHASTPQARRSSSPLHRRPQTPACRHLQIPAPSRRRRLLTALDNCLVPLQIPLAASWSGMSRSSPRRCQRQRKK